VGLFFLFSSVSFFFFFFSFCRVFWPLVSSLLPFGFFVLFKFEEKKEELVFSAAAQKVPNREKEVSRDFDGTIFSIQLLDRGTTTSRRGRDRAQNSNARQTNKQTNANERWAKLTLKRRSNPSFRNNPPRAINSKFEFPIRLKG